MNIKNFILKLKKFIPKDEYLYIWVGWLVGLWLVGFWLANPTLYNGTRTRVQKIIEKNKS